MHLFKLGNSISLQSNNLTEYVVLFTLYEDDNKRLRIFQANGVLDTNGILMRQEYGNDNMLNLQVLLPQGEEYTVRRVVVQSLDEN